MSTPYRITVPQINNPISGENYVPVDWRAFRRLQPAALEVEDAAAVFDEEFKKHIESYLQSGDPWDIPRHNSLRNVLLQLHSLKKVAGLQEEAAREHGPFDVIIALRSDLWMFNWISIEHVRAAMQSNTTVYMPISDTSIGLDDRFAFGHPDAMNYFMHRLDAALEYPKQELLHPESFLKSVVENNKLIAFETDIILERVRADGFLYQLPVFHKGGGLASWKPGRWMRKNRLAMWELSAMPEGFVALDSISVNTVKRTASQRSKWSS